MSLREHEVLQDSRETKERAAEKKLLIVSMCIKLSLIWSSPSLAQFDPEKKGLICCSSSSAALIMTFRDVLPGVTRSSCRSTPGLTAGTGGGHSGTIGWRSQRTSAVSSDVVPIGSPGHLLHSLKGRDVYLRLSWEKVRPFRRLTCLSSKI